MTEDPPMCPICGGLHPTGHRDKELEDNLETLKPILKQIEVTTNLRPPVTSMERLLLNELWFCVWDVLKSSEFKEKGE